MAFTFTHSPGQINLSGAEIVTAGVDLTTDTVLEPTHWLASFTLTVNTPLLLVVVAVALVPKEAGVQLYVYAGEPPVTEGLSVANEPLQKLTTLFANDTVGLFAATIMHEFDATLTQPVVIFFTCSVTVLLVPDIKLGELEPLLQV